MTSMQWAAAFYWIGIVVGVILGLLIVGGILFGVFELMSTFMTHVGATVVFIILSFFFIRFVIVLAAFPTSHGFVQRILEQSHSNELSTQFV